MAKAVRDVEAQTGDSPPQQPLHPMIVIFMMITVVMVIVNIVVSLIY